MPSLVSPFFNLFCNYHTKQKEQNMPVILATQEAENRRIAIPKNSRQIDCETLSQKNPSQKRVGGVAPGVGPEFKLQYHKKKKKEKKKEQASF
jgi:hypothetical protein